MICSSPGLSLCGFPRPDRATPAVRPHPSLAWYPPTSAGQAFIAVPRAMNAVLRAVNTAATRLEGCSVIINVAASPGSGHSRVALQAAPYLTQHLGSTDPNLQEQAAWALGNMAGDGEACDMLVAQGAVVPLTRLLGSAEVRLARMSHARPPAAAFFPAAISFVALRDDTHNLRHTHNPHPTPHTHSRAHARTRTHHCWAHAHPCRMAVNAALDRCLRPSNLWRAHAHPCAVMHGSSRAWCGRPPTRSQTSPAGSAR